MDRSIGIAGPELTPKVIDLHESCVQEPFRNGREIPIINRVGDEDGPAITLHRIRMTLAGRWGTSRSGADLADPSQLVGRVGPRAARS